MEKRFRSLTGKRVLCLCAALLLTLSCLLLTGCKKDKDEQEKTAQTPLNSLKDANIGDYIVFGSYEQDNNLSNGKEPIEWLVLDKEGNKALIISRYVLDCQQFNPSWSGWNNSTLRQWMNGTFMNNAFSADEQGRILAVEGWRNEAVAPVPEGVTQTAEAPDKIFLLSGGYFHSKEARKCAPTDYAIAQGAEQGDFYVVDDKETCRWWTDGTVSDGGNYVVDYDGSANERIYAMPWNQTIGVRPAMWINLN